MARNYLLFPFPPPALKWTTESRTREGGIYDWRWINSCYKPWPGSSCGFFCVLLFRTQVIIPTLPMRYFSTQLLWHTRSHHLIPIAQIHPNFYSSCHLEMLSVIALLQLAEMLHGSCLSRRKRNLLIVLNLFAFPNCLAQEEKTALSSTVFQMIPLTSFSSLKMTVLTFKSILLASIIQ